MDPITQQQALAAAGAAGGGESLYVDDVFSTYVYTGNASTQTITNGIDLSGEGGMVWCKPRNASNTDEIVDTERGINSGLAAIDGRAASSSSEITSFNSDGYTLGYVTGLQNFNARTFASWTFRKAPGFFDVVTWTGDGSSTGQVISHNLGSTPGFIVIKETNGTAWWACWHRSLGGARIFLNETSASTTANIQLYFGNGTSYVAPTDSSFTVNSNDLNQSGNTYVAYIFAHDDAQFGENEDESIIKCGSYTGDGTYGNAEGNHQNLGFEPQFLIIKNASRNVDPFTGWHIFDNMRGVTYGKGTSSPTGNDQYLYANKNNSEATDAIVNFTATGFSLTNSGYNVNFSGDNYIYIAIRRPHKPPEAGTDVFAIDFDSASSTIPTWDSGFPVDMAFALDTLGGSGAQVNSSRLIGSGNLQTSSTAAEFSDASLVWDSNLGWGKVYSGSRDYISWMFRRAPGFFDVVAYTGTGVARTVDHNLAVAPELMIIKKRNGSLGWVVYHQALGASAYLFLHGNSAEGTTSTFFNATTPTASSFSVGTSTYTNASSDTYIAYLFASLAGISKVGSYGGTGSNVDVDCGFTAGARFVLIKRSDTGGTGDWYVWDSTRGIVSGNDPYLLLNSTAAEVTSTDYIDPLNSGFTVTSSAPAALNASGGTYIFLAIA